MVFHSHRDLNVDHIPDDIILPNFIFNLEYGRRRFSQSNKALFVDAPTGKVLDIAAVKERTDSLAKGLSKELNVQVGWNGVVGVFAPNHVLIPLFAVRTRLIVAVDRFCERVLGNSSVGRGHSSCESCLWTF